MSRSSACENSRPGHENAVAFGGAAADAAAQLVQLRQTEALGMFDHHDRGIGHVNADFDDGSCYEHVDFAALKAAHDDFLIVGIEAAMEQTHAKPGERTRAELLVHLDSGLQS